MGRKRNAGLVPGELWRPFFTIGRRGTYPIEDIQKALRIFGGEDLPGQAKVAEVWEGLAPGLPKTQDKEKADE